ncbi:MULTISPECIES: helix-turn-helix domain-containing protein [Streptomyces]|uniref:Diguanylate phosphodiesterase n=1 Tax=Streptomyces venezuelae TaxID=54571 RepID=A0A5P2AIF6_STRVZ|nr:GAF domain-containing protein [Streptomyces venezuelae]QES17923.1 diguanylate phosphodiesterase [Streptomyces venezuelae]
MTAGRRADARTPSPTETAARRLFDLLAADSPAQELAREPARSRAVGAVPADVAWIEETTEVALSVRRVLDQYRRREAELVALFDTAGDLARLRDLDSVLRAIVRRARTLLGSDVAYLTLNDPVAHDTFMRVTEGSVSAAFQQLRLGMGEGLGGLVAQTARPYASTDYHADPRYRHTGTIDDGVSEEGLRGILGVPLRLGEEIIGVLFAADRTPREFTPDAIALLASLADHAAVAIDSTRRLGETRTALARLEAANARAHAHSEALHQASDAHDRLSKLVLRGAGTDEVAAEIAALLGGGVAVHDTDGSELARVGTDPVTPPPASLDASHTEGRAVHADGVWTCAVLAGAEPLGSIVLTGRAELPEADRRLFERAALVTAMLLLIRRSVAETEDRVRGELLDDLLAGPASSAHWDGGSLTLRARRLGLDLARPHAVAVLDCAPALRPRLAAENSRTACRLGGLAGTRHGNTVLLAPCDRPGTLARDLAADLARIIGAPVTVGAAGPGTGPEQHADLHAEAQRCLTALHSLGRTGSGADIAELGFIGVLLGDRADIASYVDRVLGPVLAYDTERGTELVRTLHAYYEQGSSLARAKDALHVHVNTVVQRLDRVAQLLGPDWNTPASALEIHLALRLHQLSHGTPGH